MSDLGWPITSKLDGDGSTGWRPSAPDLTEPFTPDELATVTRWLHGPDSHGVETPIWRLLKRALETLAAARGDGATDRAQGSTREQIAQIAYQAHTCLVGLYSRSSSPEGWLDVGDAILALYAPLRGENEELRRQLGLETSEREGLGVPRDVLMRTILKVRHERDALRQRIDTQIPALHQVVAEREQTIAALRQRVGELEKCRHCEGSEVDPRHVLGSSIRRLRARLAESERVIAVANACAVLWDREMTDETAIAFAAAFERLKTTLTTTQEPRESWTTCNCGMRRKVDTPCPSCGARPPEQEPRGKGSIHVE